MKIERRHLIALSYGAVCHGLFGLGVGAMVGNMFFGMQFGQGIVSQPWAWVVNIVLLAQFCVGHTWLLTAKGRGTLARMGPEPHGKTLSTTVYAGFAGLQLLVLFALWTPSEIVWWSASGAVFWALCAAYGSSWLLLFWSQISSGLELQTGLLGWFSLLRGREPRFPDMPTTGLFRLIRQPIYATFSLTLWTVPVWTPDQLLVAVTLTAYCVIAPRHKESRFAKIYGERWRAYRARTPYFIPGLK